MNIIGEWCQAAAGIYLTDIVVSGYCLLLSTHSTLFLLTKQDETLKNEY